MNLRNVRVMRGRSIVLDDFTLAIEAAERVAILGPNGCGKSTLIKTLTRECYPVCREGSSITILGRDDWNVFELRGLLGIVQNDLLSSHAVSGRDVVLSGFFSSAGVFSNHIVRPAQRELADAALARLEVLHLAERSVVEMSSGEAKRVLIARALVHQPKALLFDEPSNSLDVRTRQDLRQTIGRLVASGIGIILVTHDLADIVPEITRVVLMSGGRVVADGPKNEMLEEGRLCQLFGTKVKVEKKNGCYHLW